VLAGAGFALLSNNSSSLSAIIISLDKENFQVIRALPMDMKKYLQAKFLFVARFQILISNVLLLGCAIFFRLPISFIAGLLIGNLVLTYLLTLHYFIRDYKLLSLNWMNVSELWNRGGGNLGMFLTMMLQVFLVALLIGGTVSLLIFLPKITLVLSILWMVLIAVASVIYLQMVKNNFWKKIE
jgi:ABC-2 type transport system permease protein